MAEESTELCAGCGSGEGMDRTTCDRCGKTFCTDCGPERDDDAPIDLCEECCQPVVEQQTRSTAPIVFLGVR